MSTQEPTLPRVTNWDRFVTALARYMAANAPSLVLSARGR